MPACAEGVVADAPSQVASSVETNKNVRQRLGKERRKEDVPEASRASAKTRPRDAISPGPGKEVNLKWPCICHEEM
jgi:hypothetical protein